MFRQYLLAACLILMCNAAAAAQPLPDARTYHVLSYHHVHDDTEAPLDRYSISVSALVQHFSWLKVNGYHIIGIADVLAARAGTRELPDKAVMLTFDDGLKSFRTRVYPLLRAFDYPAMIALVGSWLELPDETPIPYGRAPLTRSNFLAWGEIRDMLQSGLVEIASHSYDLHRGLLANPQGNEQPAAIVRAYDPQHGYENDLTYHARVEQDLQHNNDLIQARTGVRPRVIVWPYGRYSGETITIATELGMPIGMNLDLTAPLNSPHRNLDRIQRHLVSYDHGTAELAAMLRPHAGPAPVRVMHVDLDYVFDPNPEVQERNLGRLLDRVKNMQINTVFLQAFADPDGDGVADALYFPNRRLPVRADLFSRAAWQLHTRAGVEVYAWMPLLAFDLPERDPARTKRVLSFAPAATGYQRLSPFDLEARRAIQDIYDDLGRHAVFQGLLFHDDATLSDFEDASPAALNHYATVWNLPRDIAQLRADADLFQRWTRLKTRYLTEFSLELAERVKHTQGDLRTVRNLYPRVVLEPASEAWFAQSLDNFLASYDYTAVMAMPFMEGATEPLAWLHSLVDRIEAQPEGLRKTVFEFQSVDWRHGNAPIDSRLLARQMREFQTRGAVNFGYYPDDFLTDQPRFDIIRPEFSRGSFPYRESVPSEFKDGK